MDNSSAYFNIVPLVAPVDLAGTATSAPYINLRHAHGVSFFVMFGLITSATAADAMVVTVQAATAEGGAEAAIAFTYRKSGAVGTNTWGAATAAPVGGVSLDNSDSDGVCLWITVNPSSLGASDYKFVRVAFTDTPDLTACLVSLVAFVDQRYRGASPLTATASASA